jgi:hypothetical protein
MTHHVALFQFRLMDGQSIGPLALRRLWALACQSENVTVSRQAGRFGSNSHTYSLCGPTQTANLATIEVRLRSLLEKKTTGATNTLVRLA